MGPRKAFAEKRKPNIKGWNSPRGVNNIIQDQVAKARAQAQQA